MTERSRSNRALDKQRSPTNDVKVRIWEMEQRHGCTLTTPQGETKTRQECSIRMRCARSRQFLRIPAGFRLETAVDKIWQKHETGSSG